MTTDAKPEVLIFRLKRGKEVELVHHFKEEGRLLLFVVTSDEPAYERLLQQLAAMPGIAGYEGWPFTPVCRSFTIPTYLPKNYHNL
ncbi:MAG: hypothetical protein JWQ34_2626 [Mucilaginibacter sp.]|nr:hypothetical protein [Mucilaginibacter sp.]